MPMMKCGHRANAHSDDKPVCAICVPSKDSFVVVTEPNLENRKCICAYCKKVTPSKNAIAFFEYRPDNEYDLHYDGCMGWN